MDTMKITAAARSTDEELQPPQLKGLLIVIKVLSAAMDYVNNRNRPGIRQV
jgi:hypothetical protein